MKCSSSATECDKICLMAHPVAFESFASAAVPATAATRPGLTAEQMSLLSAVVSALTPAASIAGAWVESLERRLNGPLARLRPAVQQGLAAMDAECLRKTGSGILELSAAERGKFVRELRSGHKLTAFFRLVTSTLQ
jgi:hypothetical protein